MTIRSVEGGSEDKSIQPVTRAEPDFLAKIQGRICSEVASERTLEKKPPVVFYEEGIRNILECYKELFPCEEALTTVEEVFSHLAALCKEVESDSKAPGSEKKAEAIAKIAQTICQSAMKSLTAPVINPKMKSLATKRIVVVSCLNDLSNVFRFLSSYVKDVNPLMSGLRMSVSSTCFSSLLIAVDDFKKLLAAHNVKDTEGVIQESIALLMDLDRSTIGFSFLIGQAAQLAVAAGESSAAQVASSSAVVGYDVMGSFYVLLGIRGFTRLSNLFCYRKEMGVDSWEPKDLEALKFFKEKMEITPLKVFNELKTQYGGNLKDLLKKEARLQAKTIYESIKSKGKIPGLGDFISWGRALLQRESEKEREDIDRFSLNMAAACGKENQERFQSLLDLSKLRSDYPQLAELDQEGLMGLSIVCSRMESRVNKELERLTEEKHVSKVQKYVEGALKEGKRIDESLTPEELEEAKALSKELRAAYWQKVRESAGLLLMTGLGLTVLVLSGPFAPVIIVSCAAFLSACKAYGYDYKKMQTAIANLDPLKPYDKMVGWGNFWVGIASAALCGVLVGASIASFGTLPLVVAGVVITAWIVGSCYDLYKIRERERFWSENENIWKGETIEGQTVRSDLLPKSLGGRVHNITHDEFSQRIEKIALHKIKEATISKEKKKEAIDSFKSKNSVFQITLDTPVTDDDFKKASEWFATIQKFLDDEELALNKLLTEESNLTGISIENSSESTGSLVESKPVEEVKSPLPVIESDELVDRITEVSTPKLSTVGLDSIKSKKSITTVTRASFPPSPHLIELQKKIEKTKAHILRLEEQRQKTKSAGAGRQKRVGLGEQIATHRKRLEKLEVEEKAQLKKQNNL